VDFSEVKCWKAVPRRDKETERQKQVGNRGKEQQTTRTSAFNALSIFVIYLSKEVLKSNFRQYGQRREEKKKEDQKRERVRGKKMQAREKVEKSRNTVFFQCFVAPRVEK